MERRTDDCARRTRRALELPLHQHFLELGNRLGGVQALGADLRAVQDRVAAV